MALGVDETTGNNNDEVQTNQTTFQEVSTNFDGDGTTTTHQKDTPTDLVWTLVSKHLGTFIAGQCHTAYTLQPLYYHIGCAFFLLAFLAPSHRYGAALYMRCMLVFGCILFAMWSYLTECRPDVLMWSAIFIIANLIHMVILICKLRPVKFEKEIEEVRDKTKKKKFKVKSLPWHSNPLRCGLSVLIRFTVESLVAVKTFSLCRPFSLKFNLSRTRLNFKFCNAQREWVEWKKGEVYEQASKRTRWKSDSETIKQERNYFCIDFAHGKKE